jgi:hypothetical protein
MQSQTGLPSKSDSGEELEDGGLEEGPFVKNKHLKVLLQLLQTNRHFFHYILHLHLLHSSIIHDILHIKERTMGRTHIIPKVHNGPTNQLRIPRTTRILSVLNNQMTPISFELNQSSQNTNQFSIPEIQSIRGNWNPRTRGNHEGPMAFIPSREIIGIHFLGRGTTPFEMDMKGAQRLDRGIFTPSHERPMHHVMVESIRVLQRKKISFIKQSHLLPLPFAPTC